MKRSLHNVVVVTIVPRERLMHDLSEIVGVLEGMCSICYNRSEKHIAENYLVIVAEVTRTLYDRINPIVTSVSGWGFENDERIWICYASGLYVQIVNPRFINSAFSRWGGTWIHIAGPVCW